MATGSSRHIDVQARVISVLIVVLIVVLTMQTDLILSKYTRTLAISNKRRYLEKISGIEVDPYYILCSELSDEVLPPVGCTDMFNYLVLGTSFCTTERFKAFKSLDAYKYFESGFVSSVGAKKIGKKVVTTGKVSHMHWMYDNFTIIITCR